MSYSAAQIFDLIAPELSTNASKDAFLQMASEAVDSNLLGNNAPKAVAYRAAHDLTLTVQRSTGEGCTISQKKDGELSIAYQNEIKGSDYWDLTWYGKVYKSTLASSVCFFGVTGGTDTGYDVSTADPGGW